uniref:Uncharacterized protein n=1 Tax=Arundo donax TaxID=35708 RepID=A0A0A9CD47_ARUDO
MLYKKSILQIFQFLPLCLTYKMKFTSISNKRPLNLFF